MHNDQHADAPKLRNVIGRSNVLITERKRGECKHALLPLILFYSHRRFPSSRYCSGFESFAGLGT